MQFPPKPRFPAITVYLPCALFVVAVVAEQVFGYHCFTACEDGPIENLQALIVFAAFCMGGWVLMLGRGRLPVWAMAFLAIGAFGSLYAALEEISYGQRIFGWATPEVWEMVNDQDETNLHNTSSWLDQKPRMMLEIGVFIGGIVMPLLRRYKPQALPARFTAVYPDDALFTTALLAVGTHAYQLLTEWTSRQDLFIIGRGSELQETYMFWFILLYFIFKRREVLTASAAPGR